MLTKTVRFQVLAFIVIAVLGITYLGVRYIGVEQWFGGGEYTVSLDLPQSGGIFTNAEVTYRGVPVGRVGDLSLTHSGIRVHLDITSSQHIPRDTVAVVADRSVIGEQYVDLRPRTSHGPYLTGGSVLHSGTDRLPPPVENLLASGDALAKSVPIASLQTVVNQLYSATQGVGGNLGKLITTSKQFFATADANLPQTVDLINTSKTVLATQNAESGAIKAFSSNLRLIGEQLRSSNGDLSAVLSRTAGAASQFGGLIKDIRGSASALLANLLVTSAVFLENKDNLRSLLVNLPVAVSIGGSVVTPQGINVGLVPTFFDPLPCTAGYQGTHVRSGLDTSGNPPLNTSAGGPSR